MCRGTGIAMTERKVVSEKAERLVSRTAQFSSVKSADDVDIDAATVDASGTVHIYFSRNAMNRNEPAISAHNTRSSLAARRRSQFDDGILFAKYTIILYGIK